MGTQRETAYFGGWIGRALAGGTSYWGDPLYRNMEIRATGSGVLVQLPDEDREDFVGGVPYRVINVNHADDPTNYTVTVVDKSGTTIGTVAAGASVDLAGHGEFVWAGSWMQTSGGVADLSGTSISRLTFKVPLAGNYANINLYDYAVSAGYNGEDNALIDVVIAPGSIIGSTSTSTASITTDVASRWGAGTRVLITVRDSYLIGAGGDGGQGAAAPFGGTAVAGSAGSPGGPMLDAYIDVHINNIRSHMAGGSGGGGGGGARNNPGGGTGVQGGNGGGGGRGANMTPASSLVGSAGGLAGAFDPGSPGYTRDGGQGTHLAPGDSFTWVLYKGGRGGDAASAGSDGDPAVAGANESVGGSGGASGALARHASGVSVSGSYTAPEETTTVDPVSGDTITVSNAVLGVDDMGFAYNGSMGTTIDPNSLSGTL